MFGTLVVEKKTGRKIYRKQRGRGLPLRLITSATASFPGEVGKLILKKYLVVGDVDDETKNCI